MLKENNTKQYCKWLFIESDFKENILESVLSDLISKWYISFLK